MENKKEGLSWSPRIKICGITSEREIAFINEFDVDFVGFVFARSKRQVTPERVAVLRKALRGDIKAVGVFTNTPAEAINEIAKQCNLDIIQIHRSEKTRGDTKLRLPIWKGLRVKEHTANLEIRPDMVYDAFVLDTYVKGRAGGTGKTFHWELVKGYSKKIKIVLAGGLHAGNVKEAIRIVTPQIVDVSTGVEGVFGKDKEKTEAFIRAVKGRASL